MKTKKEEGSVKDKTTTELVTLNKKSKLKLLGKQKMLILMSLPFVLYIILFRYIPLWGWTMAFQDYKPYKTFSQQEWVGFKWFVELFKQKEFLLSLRNTVGMSLISTALGYITAIVLAVFMNEVRFIGVKRFVQTVSYLPHSNSVACKTKLLLAHHRLDLCLEGSRLEHNRIPWCNDCH